MGKILDAAKKTGQKINEAAQKLRKITWSDLVALRDSKNLVSGMQYRIVDYEFSTLDPETKAKSGGCDFDIIVVADNEYTLNERGRLIGKERGGGNC